MKSRLILGIIFASIELVRMVDKMLIAFGLPFVKSLRLWDYLQSNLVI